MKRYETAQPMTMRVTGFGDWVPYTDAAAIEAERDALREEITTLRATLAAERALRTLRPMSEAKPGVVVLCVRDADEFISGMPSPWVPEEMACVGRAFDKEEFFGWLPLPEPIEPPTPDTEHYHD